MQFTWSGLPPGTERDIRVKIKLLGGYIKMCTPGELFTSQITHLIVGSLGSTYKVHAALAAGIPILHVAYITDSHKAGVWLEVENYDLGSSWYESLQVKSRVYIPPLSSRQSTRKQGGLFRNWRVLVLLENRKKKETYDNIIQLGGGEAKKWTARHLADMDPTDLNLTHLFMEPAMLINPTLSNFWDKCLSSGKIEITSPIYITTLLTKQSIFNIKQFSILERNILNITLSEEMPNKDLILSKAATYRHLIATSFSSKQQNGETTVLSLSTHPSHPSQPIHHTQPSLPIHSIHPTQPSLPTQAIDPTQPSLPTQPIHPNQPSPSTRPIHPTQPSLPAQPIHPTQPSLPNQPCLLPQRSHPTLPIQPTLPSSPPHIPLLMPVEEQSTTWRSVKRSCPQEPQTKTRKLDERRSFPVSWWTDEKLRPKQEYLREPYEAVMDRWADYRDPDWCDRKEREIKYGDELKKLYKDHRKLRKTSGTK